MVWCWCALVDSFFFVPLRKMRRERLAGFSAARPELLTPAEWLTHITPVYWCCIIGRAVHAVVTQSAGKGLLFGLLGVGYGVHVAYISPSRRGRRKPDRVMVGRKLTGDSHCDVLLFLSDNEPGVCTCNQLEGWCLAMALLFLRACRVSRPRRRRAFSPRR